MKRAVAAFIAGVVLASGVATAASHYLITNINQIKPSVLARLKGRRGPRGPQGVQGVRGPAGVVSRPVFVTSTTPSDTVIPDGGSHRNGVVYQYDIQCPAPTYAVTGGVMAPGGGQPLGWNSAAGYPMNDDQTWHVDWNGTQGTPPTVKVFAICVA
jgi:hypothetical protein